MAPRPHRMARPAGASASPVARPDAVGATTVPVARVVVAVLPALVVLGAALAAASTGSWGWLGVEPLAQSFGDLRQVTATADCVRADASWSLDSPTCDPFGRGYNYPTVWARGFAWLGIGEAATTPVAVGMMVMFAVSLGSLLWVAWAPTSSGVELAVVAVTIAGPGTWLALERANTDLFVFALASFAAVALIRRHAHWAVGALAVATAWKFFPIGALVATITTRARAVVAGLVFLAAGGFLLVVELPTIRARTPMFDRLSYGISVLPAHLTGQPPGSLTARLLGAAILAAITVLVVLVEARIAAPAATHPTGSVRSLRALARTISADVVTTALFTIGTGIFLASFLLGASWDYRLIFLLFVVVALVRHPDLWWARGLAVTIAAANVAVALDGRFKVVGDLLLTAVVPPLAVTWVLVVIAGFEVARLPGWLQLGAPARVN